MSDLDDRTTHRQTTANGELDLQWHLVFETTDQVGFFWIASSGYWQLIRLVVAG